VLLQPIVGGSARALSERSICAAAWIGECGWDGAALLCCTKGSLAGGPVWYNRSVNKQNLQSLQRVVIGCALLAWLTLQTAAAQPGKPTSQRRINDYAAAIERCRRELLEEPKLRLPGETLPAYIARICSPLPGETRTAYLHRAAGYVRSIEKAAVAADSGKVMPTLVHADATNTAHWTRITKDIGYFDRRVDHVRDAWNRVEHSPDLKADAFSAEVLTTLQLMIDAYGHLRDAAP
jgi:hypothetical protein